MELHELVERIQRWKERQAVERGEVVDPVGGAPAEAQYYQEGNPVEAPVADVAAVEEYVESIDEVGEVEAEELEPDVVEEVEAGEVVADEAGDEPVEAEGGWEEEEDSTSEVDLDQIEELEEVE